MDFGILFYFIGDRKFHPLDSFFNSVKEKTLLYEQHSNTTMELYVKEFREMQKRINEGLKAAMGPAQKRYNEIMEQGDMDQDTYDLARHESGIDEIENHFQNEDEALKYRFGEMADYFNKSSLVVLYALLESELRRLCKLLKESFGKRIALQDLNDKDYLKSIMSYMNLVIELPTADLESYETKFRDLQYLRNRIMHNGAEFPSSEKNDMLDNIIKQSNKHLVLAENGDPDFRVLRIKNIKYVNQYYALVRLFFCDLLWLIDKKLNHAIAITRLQFLFEFLAKDLVVRVTKAGIIKGGKQIICELESTNASSTFKLGCNITMKKAKADKLSIINQVSEFPSLERLIKHLETYPETVIKETLGIFLFPDSHTQVDLTTYPAS